MKNSAQGPILRTQIYSKTPSRHSKSSVRQGKTSSPIKNMKKKILNKALIANMYIKKSDLNYIWCRKFLEIKALYSN